MAGNERVDEGAQELSNEAITQTKDAEDVTALVKNGFEALMPAIRASNSLPKGSQWDLFCTSSLFKPTMETLGKKTLELMTIILQSQGMNRDIRRRDLEEKQELVVEANDKILERVNIHLDELAGIRRNPSEVGSNIPISPVNAASGSWNRYVSNSAVWKEVQVGKSFQTPVVLRNARVTERPQVKFLDKIDNRSIPFEPRIKEKPNSLRPLAILLETIGNEDECYSHPYEYELDRFQEKIDSLNLNPRRPLLPKPLEKTPLLTITEENQLMEMLEELRSQSEIAVDLEHHSYRSFQGFTCLMQISTREKDYLIDTLELRHKLYVLNEVFTNPKIVKVFHGADSDVQWLQRDLCLYVVNMFDTYQAALLLSLPRLSLAFLLKSFCNIDANKSFQLYDWRTRPLAKEAIKYAREDTHYLLYIYDVLWNRLLEKSNGGTQLLQSVIYRSADTCKRRYWKSLFKEDSYEGIYRQSKKTFDNRQMYALKEIFAWRDRTAREEDESIGYVLPNHMLLLIAEKLPKEMQGILACCNPIPPLVRQNLVLLHQIILKAREQPLVSRPPVIINSENRVRPTTESNVNLEGPLHCPHDLTHNLDFRDDLATLLDTANMDINCNFSLMEKEPLLAIFEDADGVIGGSTVMAGTSKKNLPNQIHFMSPFERYKKMLVYMEAEDKKSAEEKEREIAQDTQKLLDECMRERLKSSGAIASPEIDMVHVKEETQDNSQHSRKRNRSPSLNTSFNKNSKDDDDLSNSFVKSENDYHKYRHKHKESIKNNGSSEDIKSREAVESAMEHFNSKNENNDTSSENRSIPPKKKKKMNTEDTSGIATLTIDGARKAESSDDFKQYDYSQIDYSQYHQPESSKPTKSSQDKFRHKGKKKNQNRTFTFARQYGRGGSSKNS